MQGLAGAKSGVTFPSPALPEPILPTMPSPPNCPLAAGPYLKLPKQQVKTRSIGSHSPRDWGMGGVITQQA